jgi:hypothetical protein
MWRNKRQFHVDQSGITINAAEHIRTSPSGQPFRQKNDGRAGSGTGRPARDGPQAPRGARRNLNGFSPWTSWHIRINA